MRSNQGFDQRTRELERLRRQLQSRNKTLQTRKKPDKSVGDNNRAASTTGAGTDMRKLVTSSMIVLLAALSIGGASTQPQAKGTVTRTDRCNRLQQQFTDEIAEHAEAKRAAEAKALQKKAMKFCAGNQQAQGIRAYATALKMLGAQPIEP
ncbi:hypothetical protein [Aminobacter sp. SR38]|jgi:hypothetical protein|uniref:hypothetical protein n=1 Tax=Aminobacter sp. SR38 TaxID=2774562 RepID=UPI001FEFF941|nr:hypothetical protein [Aminobacter sp. SR38]